MGMIVTDKRMMISDALLYARLCFRGRICADIQHVDLTRISHKLSTASVNSTSCGHATSMCFYTLSNVDALRPALLASLSCYENRYVVCAICGQEGSALLGSTLVAWFR